MALLYFFIIFSLLYSDTKVEASLDSNNLFIGEQAILKIKIVSDTLLLVSFPPKDLLGKNIITLEDFPLETLKTSSEVVLEKSYRFTSFDTGVITIASLPVITGKDTLWTNPLYIRFNFVPVDTSASFKPIKEIIEVDYTLWDWIKDNWKTIAIIGIILILVIAGILYIIFRKKIKEVISSLKPKEPPHVVALKRLDALEKQKLWEKGLIKEFYFQLSFIFREYIDARFSQNSLQSTATEFIKLLENYNYWDQNKDDIKWFIEISELVKYAKFKPLPSENEKSLKIVRMFVENTIPQPSPSNQVNTN